MRKLTSDNMKLKSLFIGLLAATLAFVGCSQESSVPSIKAVALEISKDAGEYGLRYSINNASHGGQLSATTDAEWIYDIRVEADSVFFSAEQNADKGPSLSSRYLDTELLSITKKT